MSCLVSCFACCDKRSNIEITSSGTAATSGDEGASNSNSNGNGNSTSTSTSSNGTANRAGPASASKMYVTNKSSVVSDQQIVVMIAACNLLMPQLSAAWSVECPEVVFRPAGISPAAQDWLFYVIDQDSSEPNALAYHSEDNDQVDGYILARTILLNGGVPLYLDSVTPTVASALFHELAEALLDPTVNGWWQTGDGSLLFASEICDPVQGNIVPVTVTVTVTAPATAPSIASASLPSATSTSGSTNATKTSKGATAPTTTAMVTVGLSDFVTTRWKDPQATVGPFNYLDSLSQPFEIDAGGYAVVFDMRTGREQQLYGEKMPQWLRRLKHASYRSRTRRGQKLRAYAAALTPASLSQLLSSKSKSLVDE